MSGPKGEMGKEFSLVSTVVLHFGTTFGTREVLKETSDLLDARGRNMSLELYRNVDIIGRSARLRTKRC